MASTPLLDDGFGISIRLGSTGFGYLDRPILFDIQLRAFVSVPGDSNRRGSYVTSYDSRFPLLLFSCNSARGQKFVGGNLLRVSYSIK
jgi:hypothetical protein